MLSQCGNAPASKKQPCLQVGHHPLYSYGHHADETLYMDWLKPMLSKHNVSGTPKLRGLPRAHVRTLLLLHTAQLVDAEHPHTYLHKQH